MPTPAPARTGRRRGGSAAGPRRPGRLPAARCRSTVAGRRIRPVRPLARGAAIGRAEPFGCGSAAAGWPRRPAAGGAPVAAAASPRPPAPAPAPASAAGPPAGASRATGRAGPRGPPAPAAAAAPPGQAAASGAAAPRAGGRRTFLARFAKGAGVPPDCSPGATRATWPEEIGALVRLAADSVKQLLAARTEAKRVARTGSHTTIQALDNNPLKFSPTVDDALRIMLGRPTGGYLDARRAFERELQGPEVPPGEDLFRPCSTRCAS